jgi:hypothetical protein
MVWVPDAAGVPYSVLYVERMRRIRGADFLRLYLIRGRSVAIEILELDGAPDLTDVVTIILNQATGLQLTQPAAHQARSPERAPRRLLPPVRRARWPRFFVAQVQPTQAGPARASGRMCSTILLFLTGGTNISGTQRKEAAQLYGDAAMKLLRDPVSKGYKGVTHMKKDTDLDPLRQREDFQKPLAELEGKGK